MLSDEYLGIQAIANIYHVSRQTIYRHIKSGKLPCEEIGHAKLILRTIAKKHYGLCIYCQSIHIKSEWKYCPLCGYLQEENKLNGK